MALNFSNDIGLAGIQQGNTASRPQSPVLGVIYYNTQLGYFESYTSTGWFALAAAPGSPTAVTATNVGTSRAYNNGSASIEFTPNTSGGSASSFTIRPTPATSPATFTGSASPVIATNLASNTEYTYTVIATSTYGNSSESLSSSGVIATTVPQSPTIGAVTGGNALATVAYTAGATGGAAVTAYTATSSPSGFTGTGSSPITVSGLTNGTPYTFTVTATNANGTSAASAASESATPAIASSRGVVAGGYPGTGTNNDVGAKLSSMEYINISVLSNYTSFGSLATAKGSAGNVCSNTRGLFFDNATSPQIEYITMASLGNGTTFGSMGTNATSASDGGGWSNSTRGAVFGGYTAGEVMSNVIQYVTIASTGNTTSFGTLILARYSMCGTSSTTRGIMTSGNYNFSGASGPSSEIEYVTIASTGNATSFGDMVSDRDGSTAASSNTRGLIATGYLDGTNITDAIDYITIASTGNATNFGSMSSTRRTQTGMSNSIRGVFTVGNVGQGPYYRVPTGSDEYVTIATTGNSANFGELITKRVLGAGTAADSHGGL